MTQSIPLQSTRQQTSDKRTGRHSAAKEHYNIMVTVDTTKKHQYHPTTPPSSSGGLPPIVGKIGSIVFFAILFGMASKNQDGYEQFRKCHGNCVNGILHAIGMPCAVSGVFLIVRSVTNSAIFTRVLQSCVTTLYLLFYTRYETNPLSPWLFYLVYMTIFDRILYQRLYLSSQWTRVSYLLTGIGLIAFNVGALEVIGHGYFEHHHSYVEEFFNSGTYTFVCYWLYYCLRSTCCDNYC